MICNKCNHNLPDDSVFCQYCGNKIEEVEAIEDAEFNDNTAELIAELNDPDITPNEVLRAMLDFHASATAEAATANSVDQPGDETDDDFGLTPENPIFTLAAKSVDGEHEYLDQLYTENGEKIKYKRRGSTSVKGVNGIIDIYETYLPSGEYYQTIYINMYGARESTMAPCGFVLFSFPTYKKNTVSKATDVQPISNESSQFNVLAETNSLSHPSNQNFKKYVRQNFDKINGFFEALLKRKYAPIILSILLIISFSTNVCLVVNAKHNKQLYEQWESKANKYQSEMQAYKSKADFYDDNIVFISKLNSDKLYHKLGCSKFIRQLPFLAYTESTAKSNGYKPCSRCC